MEVENDEDKINELIKAIPDVLANTFVDKYVYDTDESMDTEQDLEEDCGYRPHIQAMYLKFFQVGNEIFKEEFIKIGSRYYIYFHINTFSI